MKRFILVVIMCVLGSAWAENCTTFNLPCEANARAQYVRNVIGNKQRIQPFLGAQDALVAKWSLTNVSSSTFGFLCSADGDNYVSTTATSATVTSTDDSWVAGDVGQVIHIQGAGAAGAVHVSTITGFTNTKQITIADVAVTTVTASKTSKGGMAVWGYSPSQFNETEPLMDTTGAYYLFRASPVADNAITTGKILDLAVTTQKIADDAVTYAKLQNVVGASKLLGSGSAGAGANASEISLGAGLAMTGTTLDVSSTVAANAFFAGLSATRNDITTTANGVISAMNYITGTSADYTITLPNVVTSSGKVIAFSVGIITEASKQYTLDAGAGVLIAGRTRYLVLIHTCSLLLYSDGTEWVPIAKNLDTPWVTVGPINITATSVNPTKGTTSVDRYMWRRTGNSCKVAYEYRQTALGSGANGTGHYLFLVPYAADSGLVSFSTSTANIYDPFLSSMGSARYTNANVYISGSPCFYDSTHFRISGLGGVPGGAVSATPADSSAGLGATNVAFSALAIYPVTNW